MAAKALNIEVGKRITKVCITEKRGKSFAVSDSFAFVTPEGCVVDGQIVSEITLGDKLNEELAMRSVSAQEVYFSIASSKIASREISIPAVKDDQIKSIVTTNASDYFPVDVSKYSIDSVLLERTPEECRVLVVAVPIIIVDSYIALADYVGLTVKALDYSANSQFQVLKSIRGGEGVDMFITIDADSSSVNFSENGNLLLQRSLPIGGDEMIVRYMGQKEMADDEYIEALRKLRAGVKEVTSENPEESGEETADVVEITDEDKAEESGDADSDESGEEPSEDASEEPAEESPRDNYDPFGYGDDDDDDSAKVIVDDVDLTDSLLKLVAGLSRSLDFFRGANLEKEIGRVVLMGSCAHLEGLKEAVEKEIGVGTYWLEEMEDIQGLANSIGDISVYIGCLGSRMAPMDFLPRDYLVAHGGSKKKALNDQNFGYFGGAVCVVLALALTAYSLGGYLYRNSKLKKTESEISKLEYAEKEYQAYLSYTAAEGSINTFVDTSVNVNSELKAFFEEMEEKMPSDISVLTANCTLESISMSIETSGFDEAANIVSAFRSFESIDVIQVSNMSRSEGDGLSLVSFSIICNYPVPETEPETTVEETTAAEE
ncbi:MAG: pilus assembly protein PilM [Clostridia bacterium]|nr:pilus assembly protein PilM [Clostridia bacterium]